MELKDLPITAEIICCEYGGWIIGSSADPKTKVTQGKDIDIIVPHHQWRKVSKIAAAVKGSSLNKHGGTRFLDESISVDVWPDTLMNNMRGILVKWVWQPFLNIRFRRTY